MIKIHDGVAINPINLVAVVRNEANIAFFFVNGRAHTLACRMVNASFIDWVNELDKHVPMMFVNDGRAINVDAVVSMAKVSTGVAFNMLGGHTEYYSELIEERKDAALTRFLAEIDKLEKEAA